MANLVISVSWEYFLGLIGTLIGIAYYANGRFSRVETSVDWLTETLRDLTIRIENLSSRAFQPGSAVKLTYTGERLVEQSGLRPFIDANRHALLRQLSLGRSSDAYAVQQRAFRLFAELRFDASFEQQLNQFAFANGVSMDLLRRLGAISLRDLAINGRT